MKETRDKAKGGYWVTRDYTDGRRVVTFEADSSVQLTARELLDQAEWYQNHGFFAEAERKLEQARRML